MAYLDHHKVYIAEQAKKYLDSLKDPEAINLKEWINDKDNYIKYLQDKVEDMGKVFEGINKYTNKEIRF